ncbi:MAG: hypothetical protein JWO58_3232 [Chitinophagaceae bacterium]|nr:hypothetical protein [Chitinophagaceae bacterium]
MKVYFFTCFVLYGFCFCSIAFAQSETDSLRKVSIEQEQQELRAEQLFLQRKKDSLSRLSSTLQSKVLNDQKKREEAKDKKYKNAIALDPVYDLMFLGFEASYERAVATKQSIYISLGYYDYYGRDEYRETDKSYLKASSGYRCQLEYRMYLLPDGSVFSGLYAGPMVMYKQRSEQVSANVKDSLNHYTYHYEDQSRFGSALGIGVVAGYQIKLGHRFMFDSYVQIGGIINLGDRYQSETIGNALWDPYNSSPTIGTGISLGYKF